MPEDAVGVISWAAFWAARVAKELGLLGAWQRGEMSACHEIAGALPGVAAFVEREAETLRQMPHLISAAPLEYFQKFNQ